MRILVVEDDQRLQRALGSVLIQGGHAVDVVGSGSEADTALRVERFDLVVLDLCLPGMDGLTVLRQLRERKDDAAVIVLTARTTLNDHVSGLDLGADDYIDKPFDLSEFEARVRAVLRRRGGVTRRRIVSGNLIYDLDSRTVEIEGRTVSLPRRERDILEALLTRSGQVVTKDRLIESICNFDEEMSHKAIELYISRLRKRLRSGGNTIRVLRGIGYILDEEA